MVALTDHLSGLLFRRGIRGQTRFHSVVCGGRRIVRKTKHGLVLRLDPREYVDRCILRFGFYEEEVLAALLGALLPGDVFWDVGSNLGLHALTVAKQRPDVRVWAFEPNPAMAALARSAAEANQVAVDVREVALDSRSGRAALYLHEGNAGRNSLCDLGAGVRLPHIDVDTVLADNLVASAAIGSPNVVKIDVEGAEPRVLAGMRGILRGDRVHTVVFEDGAAAQTPTKRILHAAGFAIDPLIRREATHHLLENFVARR